MVTELGNAFAVPSCKCVKVLSYYSIMPAQRPSNKCSMISEDEKHVFTVRQMREF